MDPPPGRRTRRGALTSRPEHRHREDRLDRTSTEITTGGHRWLVTDGFAGTLRRLDWPRVRRPDHLSDAELVKDNTVRTVARLPDPDEPDGPGYYVKRYKFKRYSDRLKYLVRPTRARQEWEISSQMHRSGIPTCRVLAVAERKEGPFYAEAFLVSREIEGTVTLKHYVTGELWNDPGAAPRLEVLEELARLSGRLARQGFYHRDYHAGNILVRPSAPPGSRLFVLDLHSIRRKHALRRRHALRMLAFLGDSFTEDRVDRRERLRFLVLLLRTWKGPGRPTKPEAARWARMAERATRRHHARHMRSRTRRCVKESTMFTGHRHGRYHVHRRRDFPARFARRAAELHRAVLAGESEAGRLCKGGDRTAVTLCSVPGVPPLEADRPVPQEELAPGRVCVKSFFPRSAADRMKDLFRPRSRAREAWVALRGAAVRGIPAPRPLALLERGRFSGEPDFLVMEAVQEARNLDEVTSAPLPRWLRDRLGEALADLLNRLQDRAVYHPDVKPTNVLVQQKERDVSVYLIDMARVRFESEGGRRRWIRYLAQLNAGLPAHISLLDRMRCLRRCSRGRWTAGERLRIARAAYEKSLGRNPKWLR